MKRVLDKELISMSTKSIDQIILRRLTELTLVSFFFPLLFQFFGEKVLLTMMVDMAGHALDGTGHGRDRTLC